LRLVRSRLEPIGRRLRANTSPSESTLLVLGVFALQISPFGGLVYDGSGLLLLTWHGRIRGTYRGLLYFIALLPPFSIVQFDYDSCSTRTRCPNDASPDSASPFELVMGWFLRWLPLAPDLRNRHRPHGHGIHRPPQGAHGRLRTWADWTTKRGASARSCKSALSREIQQHGVVQTAFFCTASRTGKTFLAEAIGGSLRSTTGTRSQPVSLKAGSATVSQTSGIRLSGAYAHRPMLFFLDEIDSIGTQRQQLGRNDDVERRQLYNSVVTD